jgi:hypothetical protein
MAELNTNMMLEEQSNITQRRAEDIMETGFINLLCKDKEEDSKRYRSEIMTLHEKQPNTT